jgi:lactate dehydrogenase-like 2-hydroxyacid dehydrogenase
LASLSDHTLGVGNIDVDECMRRDVMVTIIPDVLTETTADLTCFREGEIFAAGLHVFEDKPLSTVNSSDSTTSYRPHLGSASVETRTAMGMVAAEDLFAALEGRGPPSLVNPEVWRNEGGAGWDGSIAKSRSSRGRGAGSACSRPSSSPRRARRSSSPT